MNTKLKTEITIKKPGRLFNLKNWLTIEEAAKHLSALLQEEVSAADVLQLGIDQKLQISVRFVNHVYALRGKIINLADASYKEIPALSSPDKNGTSKFVRIYNGVRIGHDQIFESDDTLITLTGVWDLPMLGGEYLDVVNSYQLMTNQADVELITLDGVFIRGLEGSIFELREFLETSTSKDETEHVEKKSIPRSCDKPHYPAGALPHDSDLVVRPKAILDFQASYLTPQNADKPIGTNERNTLLSVIAALCHDSGIDYRDRSFAAEICRMSEKIGIFVSDDTVRRIAGKIPDALESRLK